MDIERVQEVFFIGVAGAGMSALAQYLQGVGKNVSGSDRFFKEGEYNDTRHRLEMAGIRCFLQDGEGITRDTQCVVVSTAVEDSVPEVQKARLYDIPIIRRSELLAMIVQTKRSIAVGGTSGKSTTVAMLFDILRYAGMDPGIISGAGLTSLIKKGEIGNAYVGTGEWLLIEADESDGSIVQYHPHIGVLLNVDKDHKELGALMEIFSTFKDNCTEFIVNRSHSLARGLSMDGRLDFAMDSHEHAGYTANNFRQNGFEISFDINRTPFQLALPGRHNMENALAAVAAAARVGVSLPVAAEALQHYEGIYRRMQVMGKKNGTWLIDDYAHNPVKCAAAIAACQPLASKVVAWFQPHGYGPTKFLKDDFIAEIGAVLRPQDEIWMSEIFYAGGTTEKDISANDLIVGLQARQKAAFFVEDRQHLMASVRSHLANDGVLLLMGARDPSLEQFAQEVWSEL